MAEGEATFSTGKTWLDRQHGILRVVFLPGAHHDLKAAEEEVVAIARVAGGERYPALIDIGNVKSITREARAYLAGPEGTANTSARVLLSRSPLGNILANVFLAVFGNQTVPTRLFTSETEAIAWLKGFRA